jgi:hypothetical protein
LRCLIRDVPASPARLGENSSAARVSPKAKRGGPQRQRLRCLIRDVPASPACRLNLFGRPRLAEGEARRAEEEAPRTTSLSG